MSNPFTIMGWIVVAVLFVAVVIPIGIGVAVKLSRKAWIQTSREFLDKGNQDESNQK